MVNENRSSDYPPYICSREQSYEAFDSLPAEIRFYLNYGKKTPPVLVKKALEKHGLQKTIEKLKEINRDYMVKP